MDEHKRQELMKQAGEKAAEYVNDGMVVGLGTGATTEYAIHKIGELVSEGLEIIGIPTSVRSEDLARELGIPLTTLQEHPEIDLTIDGADEVDPQLNLIKGLGGALFREKIVAYYSKKEIIVADPTKLVPKLGAKHPESWLPVEVSMYGWNACKVQLDKLFREVQEVRVRKIKDGSETFITDNNNCILDCRITQIDEPNELELKINNIPGVIENGIFSNIVDFVIVASVEKGIEILTVPR